MTPDKSIYDYYFQQHRYAEHFLEQCTVDPEPEAVHQLRLCIKKLRAFDKLAIQLGLEDHDTHRKLSLRVRKMFKLAGQIRDIQVQINLLEIQDELSGMVYPEFSAWMKLRVKKRIAGLCNLHKKTMPISDERQDGKETAEGTVRLDDAAILIGTTDVLHRMLKKARRLATGRINETDLHRVRKITKQIRYIISAIHSCYPDYTFDGITISSLKEIETTAGNWHDYLIRLELIERFKDKLPNTDKPALLKYTELAELCRTELEISYNKACHVAKDKLFE